MTRKGIQLCYPFEEKRLSKWTPPYAVQPKYDGVRCRALKLADTYLLLSSEENIIYLPHITEALNDLKLDYEFDGELYRHNWAFEQINSVTSRTVNPHHDAYQIEFHIFDIVDENLLQIHRLMKLLDLKVNPPLVKSPVDIAENLDELMDIYNRYIRLGYEGIIVRNLFAPYVRKRSTAVMKFKPKKYDTYQIIGYREEVTKDGIPKDSLGSLEVWDGANAFYVGSGLTAENRRDLWKVRDSLIGKYAKVGYQAITTTNKVPRFPIFIDLVDKGEDNV